MEEGVRCPGRAWRVSVLAGGQPHSFPAEVGAELRGVGVHQGWGLGAHTHLAGRSRRQSRERKTQAAGQGTHGSNPPVEPTPGGLLGQRRPLETELEPTGRFLTSEQLRLKNENKQMKLIVIRFI